jgi:transcriptional regulator of acetoin/glycerol metabolism
VSTSRAHLALQRNRDLVQAWQQELPHLQTVLGTTSCAAMLTDATGVLVGATCVGRSHEQIMPIATRTGVNLCEEAVGTTAPGVAARTGKAVSVDGAEHFFDAVKAMHCAAAPIYNTQGRLAGVLDISSESIPFNFDAAALVGAYAAAIENRLSITQSNEHLVIRFQIHASLLDSNFVALAGIDSVGRLAWMNGTASRLLGLAPSGRQTGATSVEGTFGSSLAHLASLPRSGSGLLHLANGLMVWARCEMRAPDGHRDLVRGANGTLERTGEAAPSDVSALLNSCPPATDPDDRAEAEERAARSSLTHIEPPTAEIPIKLKDRGKDVIERTLESCGGNVSKAAELLGVSRGLIYRRLRSGGRSAH